MKDPHIGSFGAAAIAASILLKAGAMTRVAVVPRDAWLWITAVFVVARTVMVFMAALLPYARGEGGKAAPFVQNARLAQLGVAGALCAVLCLALLGPAGLALVAAGLLIAAGLRWWMLATFGGVTGDLLGASNEVTECVLFTGLALLGKRLPELGWALVS
jgi:adenosylcobinamide-GDP ribazoletransferase